MTKNSIGSKLPKDPQPSVDRIDELARRVLVGDILLPKFQRDFVWDKGQVLNLLDSVYRNYPIGSVLLWQSRQELHSENRIADLEIALPKPDYPVNYLLDGQQRLSTVCGAMHWRGDNPGSTWNIAFDLRKEQFLHLDTLDEPAMHLIRVNKLSEPSAFFQHVSALSNAKDGENLQAVANELFNRFKDYKLAVVTLGDMAIEDVAPIFERINSTGTRLTIVDLMRAATWSQDFDLIDTIDSIREELAVKAFDGIEYKSVLRNLSAAAGGGFSVDSIDNLRSHDSRALRSAASDTLDAYKRAVDFFTTEIGVPGDSVIPYQNQIVVLVELFRVLPHPTAAQYESIKHWFWRTAVSGYFAGWNTGNMASDLRSVRAFAEGKSDDLDFTCIKPRSEIWEKKAFRTNNAHAKTLAIVLGYQKPQDIVTGKKIDVAKALSWSNSREFHHFFPKNFLKGIGYSTTQANCLANIIYLSSHSNKQISDKAPSAYLKDIESDVGDKLPQWLETNLIPKEAFEAAKQNDYETFIKLRSQAIQDKVEQLASW